MGTGPNSKPVCRYRYFSTSSTGISVWGRYSIERWTIVYSGTKLGVKNSKKNTQIENLRLLKRLHTIGLAMFVWTPNSKKSQMKHTGYIVCVSWVHTQAAKPLPIDPAVLLQNETCRARPGNACNVIFRVGLGNTP